MKIHSVVLRLLKHTVWQDCLIRRPKGIGTHTKSRHNSTVKASQRYVGAAQDNNLTALKTDILYTFFGPRTELATFSEGASPNKGEFLEKFFRIYKQEFASTIFSIIPVKS